MSNDLPVQVPHPTRPSWAYLWEIHTKRVHIHAVQETSEALAKARQTLVHQLQVHEVGLQVSHGVCKFRKLRLQGIDGGLIVSGMADVVTVAMSFPERGARTRPQRGRWARGRPRSRGGSWYRSVHDLWGDVVELFFLEERGAKRKSLSGFISSGLSRAPVLLCFCFFGVQR